VDIRKISTVFFLKTKRFYIRPLRLGDVNKNYLNWFKNQNNKKNIQDAAGKKITIIYLKSYVRKVLNERNTIFLGIFTYANKHIGNIKFLKTNLKQKKTNLGIWIGDENFLNKGYGAEALRSCINFLIENNIFDKFELGVKSNNIPAIKLYKKLGFIKKKSNNNLLNGITNMILKKEYFYKNV
jgi:RimJ/RimL family protein N-acetyltransferase